MNILLISPHFPPNYYFFAVHLKRLGANVFAIAEEQFDNLHPELQLSLSEYYRVNSLEDYEQVYRGCGYLIHKHGRIDRIESHNEYWMKLETQLREDFNIFGPKPENLNNLTLKSKMKELFKSAEVPVVEGTLITNFENATKFINRVGFPVVVKPDRGMGAISTFKISDTQELEVFFNNLDEKSQYFIEEFVDGTIVSFDGLTDKDGKIVFYTAHENSSGVMEVVNANTHVYYYSYRDIPEDLRTFGFKSVKIFDVKEKFFHIEFFRKSDDKKLIALEANIRPPGGYTIDMFNFANDIDLYFEWANIVINNTFSTVYSRKYHICFIGRKNTYEYRHSIGEIIEKYGEFVVFHTIMPSIFRIAMGDYGIFIRVNTTEQMKNIINFILKIR